MPDRPETPLSVGVCTEGCVHFHLWYNLILELIAHVQFVWAAYPFSSVFISRGGDAQLFFESAIAIPQLEGSTSAIAIPQHFFNIAPQPQLCNSAIAIFSEVRNFYSATWELQFRNFRHIFGRGNQSFHGEKIGGKKSRATVPLRQVSGFQKNRGF